MTDMRYRLKYEVRIPISFKDKEGYEHQGFKNETRIEEFDNLDDGEKAFLKTKETNYKETVIHSELQKLSDTLTGPCWNTIKWYDLNEQQLVNTK